MRKLVELLQRLRVLFSHGLTRIYRGILPLKKDSVWVELGGEGEEGAVNLKKYFWKGFKYKRIF